MGLLACVALVAAACGDDDDDDDDGDDRGCAPTFEAGSTMAEIVQTGKIIIGVKYDRPGLAAKTP